jgi:hypothetical protein
MHGSLEDPHPFESKLVRSNQQAAPRRSQLGLHLPGDASAEHLHLLPAAIFLSAGGTTHLMINLSADRSSGCNPRSGREQTSWEPVSRKSTQTGARLYRL